MMAKINYWLMTSVCLLLVLLAMVFSWLRLGIDQHPLYHQWIQQEVSRAIGQQLKLESFQVKLAGADLQVSIAGIEIAEGLQLAHIDLGVDLWGSLQADALRLSHIQAVGVELSFEQQENGSWFPQTASEVRSKQLPKLILAVAARVPHLLLNDLSLTLIPLQGESISVPKLGAQVHVRDISDEGSTRVNLSLYSDKDDKAQRYDIEGQVILDFKNSQLANMLSGDYFDIVDNNTIERAQIYLHSNNLEIAPFIGILKPDKSLFHFDSVDMSGHYWLDFQANNQLQLVTNNAHFVLESSTNKADLQGNLRVISSLQGEAVFDWQLADWNLTAQALSGQVNGITLPLTELQVNKTNQQLMLLSPKLHVSKTQMLMNTLRNVPAKINFPIQSLAPKGWLHRAQLDLDVQYPRKFLFTGEMQKVSVSAWSGVPQITQADGQIWLNHLGGKIIFDDMDGLQVRVIKLTSAPWQIDSFKGEVNWYYGASINRFSSSNMDIELTQGHIKLKMAAVFPHSGSVVEPFIQLALGAQNLDLAKLPSMLPDVILGDKLGAWLTTAAPMGTVNEAALIYNGRPGSLSNADDVMARSMPMAAHVQVPSFSYHQDWPQVQGLKADLILDQKVVSISVLDGSVEHSQTTQSVKGWRVEVPVYRTATKKRGYIKVHGEMAGEASKMMTWVQKSPVNFALPAWILDLKPEGGMSLQGSVAIPFGHQSRVTYDLKLSSNNLNGYWPPLQAELRHVELEVDLNSASKGIGAIAGNGLIDGQRVHFKRLSKVNLAQPWLSEIPKNIIYDANAHLSAIQNGLTIQFKGRLAPDYLATKTSQPWAQEISGSLPFIARYSTCAQIEADCTAFSAEVDLTKAGIDLPDPLHELQQLQVLGRWQAGQQNWYATIDQHQLAVNLGIDESSTEVTILGANVVFQGAVDWAQQGQWNFGGQIDSLDVESWWEVYQNRIKPMWTKSDKDLTKLELPKIDVNIKHARWLGFDIDQSTLNLQSLTTDDSLLTPVSWRLGLTSQQLSGKVDYFGADHPLLVHVHHAHFNFPEPTTDMAKEDILENIDPSKFIDADVSIDELIKNGESFGQWQFKTRRQGTQVSVHDLDAHIRHSRMQGNLIWSKVDGVHRTQFTGRVASDDISSLLVAWGYGPALTAESAAIEVQLDWPQSPLAFAIKDSSGDLGLRLKRGSFASTPTATQGLKVLALLDMSRLIKRVQLDFSDIVQPGFSFDSIAAHYRFDHGVASSVSPITLKSTALNLSMDGWIDFKQRQVDNNLIITLPLAEKLPLAALIAGLPQLSGMIYLVNKLIGDELSTFTSARYSVTGSLDNPDVKLVRIFDKDYQHQSVQERIQNVVPID